jgi:Tol biopolymer transport system component
MRLLAIPSLVGLLAAGCLSTLCADANATLPGRNGVISFQNYKDDDAILGVRPDGKGRRRLFDLPLGGDLSVGGWKATGKRLLVEAGRRIAIADADGSNRSMVRLPDLPEPDSEDYSPGAPWYAPSWAPDSSRFAVQYNPNDSRAGQQIYVISFKGAKPKRIGYGEKPVWDPKGRWIAYLDEGGPCNAIRALKPNGTGLRTLFAQKGAKCLQPGAFDVSPDGERLTFVAPVSASRSGLFVATIGKNTARRITGSGDPDQPVWSPNGRLIAFSDGDEGIRTVELSSGKTRLVAGRYSRNPSWQPLR